MSKTIETNVIKPQINFTENLNDYILITEESENKLDLKSREITKFINTNIGKGKSDNEKDELYNNAQVIWKQYSALLQDIKLTFLIILH